MAAKPRNAEDQVSFLAPDDAAIVQLLRQNLRLLGELRSSYPASRRGESNGTVIRAAEDIAALLSPEMELLAQEQLRTVLLDTRNRVLDVVMIYQGNVNSTIVRMGEVFRDAVVTGAPNVILVHNHPSGDPSPSPEDAAMTKQAAEAGRLLGIDLLDHVIIGRGRFVSLKEGGLM